MAIARPVHGTRRTVSPLLLFGLVAVLVAGGLHAGRDGAPTAAATTAVARTGEPARTGQPAPSPTGEPAPTDDGATAGEPGGQRDRRADTQPDPDPRRAAEADPKPFAMNLYRKGDFVAQYTFEWCVGASLQMALNMATDDSRTSRTDQQRLWEMARDTSFSPFGGANPRGWTAMLNELGIGPYELVSLPTYDEALIVAAEAIRATKRPVGLVMWRGRHAWVMSGFESTADPRTFDEFDVTGIRVLDPLYPHGSSLWGGSPKPNSLVSPATLAKQFVLRDSTRVEPRRAAGLPAGPAGRRRLIGHSSRLVATATSSSRAGRTDHVRRIVAVASLSSTPSDHHHSDGSGRAQSMSEARLATSSSPTSSMRRSRSSRRSSMAPKP